MNFKYGNSRKASSQTHKRLKIDNFLGVDYASSKLNAANFRATEMKNFIHRDGVNHKRFGWNEIAKIKDSEGNLLSINGFWEFKDRNMESAVYIVHAGTKLFRIDNFGNNSFETKYTDISNGFEFLDQRSFGVVRGNFLYLFSGNKYLMYGKWNNGLYELRAVENGEKTYIPTTTIGISAEGSNYNVRRTHEEINLLHKRRRNKLIGEPIDSNLLLRFLEKSGTNPTTFKEYWDIRKQNIQAQGFKIEIVDSLGIINKVYDIPITSSATVVTKAFSDLGLEGIDSYIDSDKSDYWYYYPANQSGIIDFHLGIMFKTDTTGTGKYSANVYFIGKLKYQLDTTKQQKNIKLWIDGIEKSPTDTYLDYFGNTRTFGEGFGGSGVFYLFKNFPPTIEGESNIIIEWEEETNENADKINKCQFGIMFGYSDMENLFVSGNPDMPNYDFHSSYPDDTETQSGIPVEEDLTYFGDLGYSVIGSIQSKIMGYTLLEDGTLAIHKEANKVDPTIYLRNAVLDNAVDLEGNVIVDRNGNPYKKVYYPIFAGSMGEGMLNRFGSANLAGDKLFLSRNGVFGIVMNPNIKSNERFARERSRLVNPVLTKEDLENASAITYDNRYYLSVGGKCYIADSRFKNQMNVEMDDTFSYEWWVWDNVNARIWFILNNNLAFGTDNGQVCIFDSDNRFTDQTYEIVAKGGVMFDSTSNKFFINQAYDNLILKLNGNTTCLWTRWASASGTPSLLTSV